MNSSFATFALIALVFASNAFAQRAASPTMPSQSSNRNHDAIDWNIIMARAFTNFDSLDVTSRLTNGSKAQFTFHTERESNIMLFELTPQGKEPVSRKVNVSLPPENTFRNPSGNYHPKPGETIESFQVDLRRLFGKLAPGTYKLAMRYPRSSFEVRNSTDKIEGDLMSPAITFKISETSLAESAKSGETMPAVTLSIDKEPGPDGHTIGTLTSNSNESIAFAAYMSFAKDGSSFKPPLSTTMGSERWHPEVGWQSYPMGFCGTGLGSYELKPGAAVKVYLTGHMHYGDGIYRYRLPYVIVGKQTTGAAVSAPIVVDLLEDEAK